MGDAPFSLDREAIRSRSECLDAAVAELKSVFVGIDGVVDELVDAMRVWYLMPEVLTRPVIVNLWGMTGVGKTDLVRRLVRALDLQDRFCEVELSNSDTTSWTTSVSGVLDAQALNDERPKIVLFDEIQRFNTLDTDGKPLTITKFADFWELLSDGRLAKRQKDDLEGVMSELMYGMRDMERRKAKGEDVSGLERLGIWEAREYKRILGMNESVHDIAEMGHAKLIERVRAARTSKRVYEPVDHSKTLVIISGNLDEAFSMANLTSEADVDADIFCAFTDKITLVDVKNALAKRFKPEQVARFGNVHLIYRSLRRADFARLIAREIEQVCAATKIHFGIDVTIGSAVNELVYRNGVFPVQGVRPVFSSIADIVESNLSKLVFAALMANETTIALDYDAQRHRLVARFDATRTLEIPYTGRLDRVRQRNTDAVVANVSVHEAGHAVAYAVIFGLAPLQLTSRVASSYASGFTFPHEIHETRDAMIGKAQVYLAGGIAEEVVFGDGDATIGRRDDREQATILIIDFIRRYGFDKEFQANYALEHAHVMDKSETDTDIEKMLSRLVGETRELVRTHVVPLCEIAEALRHTGSLSSEAVRAILESHGITAEVAPEGHLHLPSYEKRLQLPAR